MKQLSNFKNTIRDILFEKLFWFGLFIKIIFSFLFASHFLTDLFIPFVQTFVNYGFQNPYEYFIKLGKSNAFPYPSLMLYILSVPQILFNGTSNSLNFNIFLFRIPLFIADFIILITLARLIKNNIKKVILYYWLSPVIIYINYIHGQLDAIPIAILFISIYFLFKRKLFFSSIFLTFACSAKTNIIIVIPLYFIYLKTLEEVNFKQLIFHFFLICIIFFSINLPFILNDNFIQMVFFNLEQVKIFNLKYNFSNDNILFLVPTSFILIFTYFISFKKISKDLYIMFLGFIFGVFVLLISPMQGWYYWIIPFFSYFYIKRNSKFDFTAFGFASLQVSYFLYFLLIKNSDYLQVLTPILPNNFKPLYSILEQYGIGDLSSNIAFTLLQSLLFINCILLFRFGMQHYATYKILSQPFLLGICGDSGSGKTTLSDAIENIFTKNNTLIIHGDDMHKWERGNENWSKLTHLNPKANLLHSEANFLKKLKNNNTIYRRHYDHNTGIFTEEITLKPKNLIVFEGLHTFYLQDIRNCFDLKIFIKPNEDLRRKWKIDRDILKRGYSKEKILEQILKRQNDSEKFIDSQIKYADILLEVLTDNSAKITLNSSIDLEKFLGEISKISTLNILHDYNSDEKQFIELKTTITKNEIELIANTLNLNIIMEDLCVEDPAWEDGIFGIMQLLVVYIIIQNVK